MQTSSARKEQITKLRSRYCKLQNADSCNKRQSSNTGAAVLAPLGAFGSAAPVSQSGVPEACRILLPTSADSKASDGPRPTRRPEPRNVSKCILPTFERQNLRFLPTFCRSKIHQKSDSSKIPPIFQKSDPGSQNLDF